MLYPRKSKFSSGSRANRVLASFTVSPSHVQPRRHRVEHLLEHEAAGGSDGDDRLLVITAPLPGHKLKRRALDLDTLGRPGVLAAGDLIDEATIGDEVVEVVHPAHQQGVLDRFL